MPPLFQLDPAQPLPLSMLPPHPATPTTSVWPSEPEKEETQNEEASAGAQPTSPAPADHPITPEPVEDPSEQPKEQEQTITISDQQPQADEVQVITTPGKQIESFSLQTPGQPPETDTPVTVSLLKQVRVWVRAEDGTTMEVKLRRGENGIRLLVFAYIAWRQGEAADRDKLLTYVIARGKRRDMNTDQLAEVFDAAKKYLRQDLDRAVNALERAGHPVEENLDFFRNEPGFYWLHPSCRITDLEAIDTYYTKILLARKEGLLDDKLDGSLPPWVIEACQQLLQTYTGDFLQTQIEKFPEECGTWIREPLTLYRDRYLDALLILANYESALGRNFLDEKLTPEQKEEQRRQHSARAAQLFFDYAMYAINSVRDRKLKFAYKAGKDGERVVMAARAIRRCVVELGKLGKPDMVDQAYLAFKERMATLSEGTWKPDKDTESDVANAKKTTSEYRFSFQAATSQQEHPHEEA
ncbi:hypothetical protein KSX_89830 [Ktedonospora formicarum]|uniref:Uncharacterized protein n=1 Tax=Ktedonospora formicarum TaxID=2778364 RepID=A0A8J3ICS2_9CHLR|nr:hypothetical protein KSX_89830 [Ktedonospora formicarum]